MAGGSETATPSFDVSRRDWRTPFKEQLRRMVISQPTVLGICRAICCNFRATSASLQGERRQSRSLPRHAQKIPYVR